METSEIVSILKEKQTELKLAKNQLAKNKLKIAKRKIKANELTLCREIIIKLGEDIQEEVQSFLEDLVTTSLQGTMPDEGYTFLIDFKTIRDQIEVKFYLVKDEDKIIEPREDLCGGTVLDNCAFSLKIGVLHLEEFEDPILLLDEPFKNVTPNYLPAVSKMVVDICNQLGLQIVMVVPEESHFMEMANNMIHIE